MRPVGIAAVFVVAGLATSAAYAAPLSDGNWLFQSNYGGGKSRLIRIDVEDTGPGPQAAIMTLSGSTIAKCSKGPKRKVVISYTAKKPRIEIVGNSSFSSKWIRLVSYSGFSGKIKLKGSIDTNRVKGTLWFRATTKLFGKCSVKEKFTVKVQATPQPVVRPGFRLLSAAHGSIQSKLRNEVSVGRREVLHASAARVNATMFIIGLILLVLGLALNSAILWTVGIVLLLIGAIMWLLGSMDRGIGGRRHYF